MRLKNETTLDDDRKQLITEDKISEIENIEGVKSVRRVSSATLVTPYQDDVYGEYYKELYQSRYSPGNYEEDMKIYQRQPENDLFNSRFIGIDDNGFKLLNESLGNILDQDAFEKGKIAVAVKNFTEGDNGITGKNVHFYLPDGENPNEEHTIQIAAVGDINSNPAYFSGGYTPNLIVSETYAKELLGDTFTELIDIEYEEAFSEDTEERVKSVFEDVDQISYGSTLERYTEMKNLETRVKVLGKSIGFIIAMLAVLNYLNMMAASVQNRGKEFATLESIGMTTRQIKGMLRMEEIGYAVISVIISLIVGIPLSYVVFSNMNTYRVSFSVSWISDTILFVIIIVLCMISPVVIYQKTQNASIIERLRNNENQ